MNSIAAEKAQAPEVEEVRAADEVQRLSRASKSTAICTIEYDDGSRLNVESSSGEAVVYTPEDPPEETL